MAKKITKGRQPQGRPTKGSKSITGGPKMKGPLLAGSRSGGKRIKKGR